MGYVKTTLGLGITYDDKEFANDVFPKLFEKFKEESPLYEPIEDEDEDEEYDNYDVKKFCESKYNLTYNEGYYHDEMTIAFVISNEDSDIRSGQDFNFSFDKKDLDKDPINYDMLELLGLKKEDLCYKVLIYNY